MSRQRLLLADDSVTIQKVVNLTFAEEGIEVITAGDGNSAMEKFVQTPPDLVMVDVNMPGIDGYKICEMIKQDDETKQIPVILLVGSFEPFDEDEARRVGADDYLTKPFQSIRQLVSRVSDLLNRSNGDKSSFSQDKIFSQNQTTASSISNFDDSFGKSAGTNLGSFDENAIDDEMIQTNQVGSLPIDETQKFVSEPNFQTAENNFAKSNYQMPESNFFESGADEKKESSPEYQTPSAENFQATQTNSAEDKIFRLDEKIFEFAAPTAARGSEPETASAKTPEMPENKKFPEYSMIADENENASGDTEIKPQQQSPDASIFDFEDLDFLELPPIEKNPISASEPEAAKKEMPENFEAETVSEKKDATESVKKEESSEMSNLSPEVIEALTKKIMEKLSAKVIQEIVQEVTPQTVESVIEEIARKKTT